MIIRTEGAVLQLLSPDEILIYAIQKGGPDAEEFINELAAQMREAIRARVFPVEDGGTYIVPSDNVTEIGEILSDMGFEEITLIAGREQD